MYDFTHLVMKRRTKNNPERVKALVLVGTEVPNMHSLETSLNIPQSIALERKLQWEGQGRSLSEDHRLEHALVMDSLTTPVMYWTRGELPWEVQGPNPCMNERPEHAFIRAKSAHPAMHWTGEEAPKRGPSREPQRGPAQACTHHEEISISCLQWGEFRKSWNVLPLSGSSNGRVKS